eukprot:Seg537.1 transcript_id=Seg537.1/GoldUCD/mRNA.D3Y31 product="hypothetical protein" protein_id=Seg537.1/GoldUCD/D3Y31
MSFANEDEEICDDIPSEWKVRRIKCLSIFVLQLFALAFDQTIISTIMPRYVKQATVSTDAADTYVTLLITSYGIATILFQLILGWRADQTRRIKRVLVLCNICSIIGNVIFSMPYGILLLMIGRFIRGIGTAAYVIVIGEVARSYVPRDLCRAISMCLTGTIIGELLGPVAVGHFKKLDFKIGTWHVWHENALSLITSGVFLIVLILTLALASDLSLEFDLKVNYQAQCGNLQESRLALDNKKKGKDGEWERVEWEQEREQEREKKPQADTGTDIEPDAEPQTAEDIAENTCEDTEDDMDEHTKLFRKQSLVQSSRMTTEKIWKIAYELVRNPITLSVMWASFVLAHTTGLFRVHSRVLSRGKVNIPSRYNSVINTLTVLTRGATYLVVGSIGDKVGDVSLTYAGFALSILSCACWLLIVYLTTDNSAMLSLFIIYLATISISSCGEIALQVLMAKLVPSNIQSFAEAFRSCFMTLGLSVADIFYKMELSIPLLSGAIITALNVVTIAIVNMNYQYLAVPKPLIHVSSRKYY